MPAAVDPFGRLGPVARKLLFHKDCNLTAYHNEKISATEGCCQKENRSKDAPDGITDKANGKWSRLHHGIYVGASYADATPKHWTKNNLAMEFLHASLDHLHGNMRKSRF